jgi:hypothetical protein
MLTFRLFLRAFLAVPATFILTSALTLAQPSNSPEQLEQLVSRIALYPDQLLAQILAAATYPDQIPDAARWADQHHYLTQDALANAITQDHLTWDPSVQALLPFPSVLDMMASDINWTTNLGNAFLAQQQDVMDAVQRQRRKAQEFGYLKTNGQVVVNSGPYITIDAATPGYLCVPYYDPGVVFFPPRPGIVVGAAIGFRFGVTIGVGAFRPWGWGLNRFDWGAHRVYVNNVVWNRTWVNRATYVHPYRVERFTAARPPERHQLQERSVREREAPRRGEAHVEEHGRGQERRK